MDFVLDTPAHRRPFRILTVVDHWSRVKTEDGCPPITDLRCPLFTDEIVHSVGSDRRIGCHLRRLGGRPSAEKPRLLLFPQSITLALDVERRGMVQGSVQDRGGQDMIVEDLAPIRKALIAGHNEAAPLVPAYQEAEEETGFFPREREVAEFI